MGMEIKRAVLGAAVGVLAALCMTGGFAWMFREEILDISHMDLAAAGVLIIASGVAALTCGRGEGRIKRIGAAEIGLLLILGAINLLLFDGNLRGMIPCILLITGTAAAVVLVSAGKQKRTYGKYRRKKQPMGKLNKKYGR